MIRVAANQDAEAFHVLARSYIAESGQGREYSVRQTQLAFEHALDDPATALFVAEGIDQTHLAGGALVQIDHAFTADPVALVGMLYIAPLYRGTGVSRALLRAACTWADDCGCSHTFTNSTAQLPGAATRLFQNLAAKFNFVPVGTPMLSRRHP